jgi:hypothetical protein
VHNKTFVGGVLPTYDPIRIGLVSAVVSFSLNLHRLDFRKLEVESSPLVVSCFNNITSVMARAFARLDIILLRLVIAYVVFLPPHFLCDECNLS